MVLELVWARMLVLVLGLALVMEECLGRGWGMLRQEQEREGRGKGGNAAAE